MTISSRSPLTDRQRAIWDFLARTFAETGEYPTFRAIVDRFEFSSTNSVTAHLRAIARKGWLERVGDRYVIPGLVGFLRPAVDSFVHSFAGDS